MSGRFSYGIRMALTTRGRSPEGAIIYDAALKFPDGRVALFTLRAEVDGAAWTLTPPEEGPEVPEWALAQLKKWVSTIVRQATRSGRWPRRLQQWKAPPASEEDV